ncbi:copper chaperone PCu(A)C [Blastococcus capsensis]|uniref:copper chaperone PCu(A)C n=1 Tax=Blastococcus capsensis TaxID=1564163 RepID=UPI0025414685|nr:copper chaperone PCu(A)C [Blastococcus capsensis]MDK3257272.1 copper chaperone PCu(A)C [Blastococcus capsensis]
MNRALRAATMGVLLFSPVALAACSAGQVTQTATQLRDQRGAMAEVGDLNLRAITLASPEDGVYEAGDDATVQLAIANPGNEDDTLTGISGEGFDEAVVETPDGSGSGSEDLEIPAGSTVFVGAEDGPTITLAGLDEELTTGEAVDLQLTFENAGEVTVRAVVTTPDEVLERGEGFDFHHEEAEGADEEAEGAGEAHG